MVVAQHFGTLLLTDLPSDYFSTSQCMLIFLELLLQWRLTNSDSIWVGDGYCSHVVRRSSQLLIVTSPAAYLTILMSPVGSSAAPATGLALS